MPDPHTDMRLSACERDLRRQRALLDWLSQRTLSDLQTLADRVNALETASSPPRRYLGIPRAAIGRQRAGKAPR